MDNSLENLTVHYRTSVAFSDECGADITEEEFIRRRVPDNYRMVWYWQPDEDVPDVHHLGTLMVLAYLLPSPPLEISVEMSDVR